jgi:Lytic polysaccharide mono-oxygenase, cellulose-degrading
MLVNEQVQTALGGRCGICGDAFNMTSKPSEAPGGMYATGTIVRSYRSAQTIPVSIVVTANHRGYFEFRLCANNDVKQDPVQDCFNRFISHIFWGQEFADWPLVTWIFTISHFMLFQRYLLIVVGSGSRYYLPTTVSQTFNVQLQLPMGVTCSQCIIQVTSSMNDLLL